MQWLVLESFCWVHISLIQNIKCQGGAAGPFLSKHLFLQGVQKMFFKTYIIHTYIHTINTCIYTCTFKHNCHTTNNVNSEYIELHSIKCYAYQNAFFWPQINTEDPIHLSADGFNNLYLTFGCLASLHLSPNWIIKNSGIHPPSFILINIFLQG